MIALLADLRDLFLAVAFAAAVVLIAIGAMT